MSLLKTNLEDLLAAKTNDARKIAKSTLAQDKDDLVSDPNRKNSDDDAQNNIDKALSTGHVYQEKEMKGKDPCWKGYQMVGKKKVKGKEVPNCIPKESVFSSIEEQEAYTSYVALKNIIEPISGEPKFNDLDVHNICKECYTISEFSNKLFSESVKLPYKKRKQFDEDVVRLEEEVINISVEDLILWESIISNIKK